jgi:hypothetical protein
MADDNNSKHNTDLIQNSAGTFVAQVVCLRVEVLFDESRREGQGVREVERGWGRGLTCSLSLFSSILFTLS